MITTSIETEDDYGVALTLLNHHIGEVSKLKNSIMFYRRMVVWQDPFDNPPCERACYIIQTKNREEFLANYDPEHGIFYYGENYDKEIGWVDNGEHPNLVMYYKFKSWDLA